jgi:hypothetical protein
MDLLFQSRLWKMEVVISWLFAEHCIGTFEFGSKPPASIILTIALYYSDSI